MINRFLKIKKGLTINVNNLSALHYEGTSLIIQVGNSIFELNFNNENLTSQAHEIINDNIMYDETYTNDLIESLQDCSCDFCNELSLKGDKHIEKCFYHKTDKKYIPYIDNENYMNRDIGDISFVHKKCLNLINSSVNNKIEVIK